MNDDDLQYANTSGDDTLPEGERSAEAILLERGASLGRYTIEEILGSGGMGIVYLAFDPKLDRKVACKVLRKKWDSKGRLRLEREAKAMAKLSHPNVVSVYEVGSDGGHVFVIMELVDGLDMESWCREGHSTRDILAAYAQAGQGLAAAHRAGLVHRDFKPQNVLIDKEGRALVTDFGLARHDSVIPTTEELEAETPAIGFLLPGNLTETGLVMGTPAYMAPEQHLAAQVDARSDQFCFCVSLYEALCGKRPYSGQNYLALREQVTTQDAQPLPTSVEVSAGIRAALAKGLSRDPAKRFPTMDALLSKLGERKQRKRLGRLQLLLASALLVALVGGAVALWAGNNRAVASCEPEPTMLEGSWDARLRKQMAESFAKTGAPAAKRSFASFSKQLDRYGEELVTLRRDICEANRGPNAVGDEIMTLQMACLQKHRQELGAVVSVFTSVEAAYVERALEAAMQLPSVEACRDLEALQRGLAPPPAAIKSEVEALRTTLTRAQSLGSAGQEKSAVRLAEQAKEQSMGVAYKPLWAEAQLTLGKLLLRNVQFAEARTALEEAVLLAEESEYSRVRAQALVALTELFASGTSRFEDARRYARQARAAIDHLGGSEELDRDLDVQLAEITKHEGKPEQALVLLLRTLNRTESSGGGEDLSAAWLQNRIARLYIALGDYKAANRAAQRSHDIVRQVLGDTHPRRIEYLALLAATFRMNDKLDEAHRLDLILREYWRSEDGVARLREDEGYRPVGRSASGLVLGANGKPVSGATVACGFRVYSDGRYLDALWGAYQDSLHRLRVVRTSADGRFHCEGTTTRTLVVVADHPDFGRSDVFTAKESTEDVPDITLRLHATGSLSGHIVQEKPVRGLLYVSAVLLGENPLDPMHSVVTYVHDGRYRLERLPPGDYQVSVSRNDEGANTLQAQNVRIEANETTTRDFVSSKGDAAYHIIVVGEHGAPVASVQLFVIAGHHDVANGAEFGEEVYNTGTEFRSHFLNDGQELRLEHLPSGLHSVCLVPLAGDYRNPEYLRTINRKTRGALTFHCHDVQLVAGQTYEDYTRIPPAGPK